MNFPTQEVLRSKQDIYDRCLDLKRAMVLGNLEREKVKIVFMDDQGIKTVETTVWAVTSKSVILKRSMVIPLERIISVD